MSPYVLILIVGSHASSSGQAVTYIPFQTLQACEIAHARIQEAVKAEQYSWAVPLMTCTATGAP